ncbi:MAG: ABC transporter permease [Candidatus Dactylopiibacterium sp.]|nr:ABC transporter permease [Candidatus Dactylopiibacterium sp.]
MNPHVRPACSPLSMMQSLLRHRSLIIQMIRRDVAGRYKGSMAGVLWSFVNPLCLLITYTFVFSVVFKARWGGGGEVGGRSEFAMFLFTGMIVYGLFSESIVRAPGLIVGNVNYVKKIVFPLEILPVVSIGTSLFHTAVSAVVLCGAVLFLQGSVPWTLVLLPLVLLPLVILAVGLSWLLASLGVFIRDVSQPIGLVMTAMLFASPVFYPVSAVPEGFRSLFLLNPLTFIIDQSRQVVLLGQQPDWLGMSIYLCVAFAVSWGGYVWFQRTRKGFANVL